MAANQAHPPEPPRFVAGTMTGTSIDGELDAALVEIRGHGLSMNATLVASGSWPLGALADDLRGIASQAALPAGEFARVARAFGELHATALAELCGGAGIQPDLAVLHGQTVFHAPPLTLQLIDPWPVAVRLACRVRYDLRSANTVSGGQGAPITPIADFVLFADDLAPKLVMNLGGFINLTLVPRRTEGVGAIRGFDVCACNHLLDRVARSRLGTDFDRDGAAAGRGRCDERIARAISHAIAPPGAGGSSRRSLGTGDEATRLVELTAGLAADDACRTIAEAIADAAARTVEQEIDARFEQVLVAGGSARNRALREALSTRLGRCVASTDGCGGIAVNMREAAGIAILGALADDGVRYSLPQVTGAASRVPESGLIEAPDAPMQV